MCCISYRLMHLLGCSSASHHIRQLLTQHVVSCASQTFIDNHDTGSTQAHWPFPHDKVSQGYAYILTHPGMPCIFYDHFFEWGDTLRSEISMLLEVRDQGHEAPAETAACHQAGGMVGKSHVLARWM